METSGQTAYDVIAYPAGVFPQSHPGRLAAVARLHGLSPPPVATARVLDIGGGEGLNLLAVAEELPGARLLNLDLAAAAIARGQAIAAAAGFANIRIAVADVLDLGELEDGSIDYLIAHGVYAWVPQPVRAALMALIGRVLSPDGIAFLSFNALPGGHYRRMLREMTLHEVGHVADPQARADAARRFLVDFGAARDDDDVAIAAVRSLARTLATKPTGPLLHDELGAVFEPQAFADVIAAAAAHGLRYLNEAGMAELDDGFPDPPAADEAALIRMIQSADHARMRFFHQVLLVREATTPRRTLDTEAMRDLFLSADCDRPEPDTFRSRHNVVSLTDEKLVHLLATAIQAWPARVRIGDFIEDPVRLRAVYRMVIGRIVEIDAAPGIAISAPGDHPRASRLARTALAAGHAMLPTLAGSMTNFPDAAARALLQLLDGTRDRIALGAAWAGLGLAQEVSLDQALRRFAVSALMVA